MSDTFRTGTEQLLLSAAIDQSINEIDFSSLAGKEVFFDAQYLRGVTDEGYIVSSMRQKLLASGASLKATRDEATYVVEARAGAVGTNRHDVLVGIPQVNMPNVTGLVGVPSTIPEIPFAKSTQQRGVAKLAVFAYNQRTGLPIWQSGTNPITADARDTWVLGTGPFQRGSIYNGTNFAGQRILLPFAKSPSEPLRLSQCVPVTAEAAFPEHELPGGKEMQTADRPKVNAPSPPPFIPGTPPTSSQQPIRTPTPAATTSQTTSGFSSNAINMAPANTTTTTPGQPITGGNAAAGLLFLGNGAKSPGR